MPSSLRRRGILGALAVAMLPAAAVSTALAAAKSTTVTMTEFRIKASPKTVSAGDVVFNVENPDAKKHELILLKTKTAASKLQVKNGQPRLKGEVQVLVESGHSIGGAEVTTTVTKGHYILLCDVRGHYAKGMRANFNVK